MSNENVPEIIVKNSVPLGRAGLCGNGICEIYERSTVGSIQGTCPEDCGLPAKSCPEGCGYGGTCFPASGICICRDGYTGPSCQNCADGYMRPEFHEQMCVPSVDSLNLISPNVLNEEGFAIISGNESSSNTSTGVIVGAVLGSLAGVILIALVFMLIRRKLQADSDGHDVFRHKTMYDTSPGSDEFGLRKKYGVSMYNFAYDSEDREGTIPSGIMHDQFTDDTRPSQQSQCFESRGDDFGPNQVHNIIEERTSQSLPAVGQLLGESGELPPAINRDISGRISYMHATEPRMDLSNEVISGYQEKLYVQNELEEDAHYAHPSKNQNCLSPEQSKAAFKIRASQGLTVDIPQHNSEEHDTDDTGAVSLDEKSESLTAENASQGEDTHPTMPDDRETRLYFNPAFSAHKNDLKALKEKLQEEEEKTKKPVEEDTCTHQQDIMDRRQRLEALRAAVRSLENREPSATNKPLGDVGHERSDAYVRLYQ